jgi:hypothetical protein
MVLPPAEVLLAGQRARGDLGLAVVWGRGLQAERNGGGPGVRHGAQEVR